MAGKVTKVEILKNETPKWDRIFWHSGQFLVMELNFLGLETRKYMFYHQINDTTFFLAYFLTLEYILEIFRAQHTNIFKKNARGGKKGYVFSPPFPIYPGLLTTCYILALLQLLSVAKKSLIFNDEIHFQDKYIERVRSVNTMRIFDFCLSFFEFVIWSRFSIGYISIHIWETWHNRDRTRW